MGILPHAFFWRALKYWMHGVLLLRHNARK
jgi:hypothetical protein